MSEDHTHHDSQHNEDILDNSKVSAPASQAALKTRPASTPVDELPRWKVLLHNDDDSEFDFVMNTICELTPLDKAEAKQRMIEAHNTGLSLLLTTHKERAELYQQQFTSKGLTVTIEAED